MSPSWPTTGSNPTAPISGLSNFILWTSSLRGGRRPTWQSPSFRLQLNLKSPTPNSAIRNSQYAIQKPPRPLCHSRTPCVIPAQAGIHFPLLDSGSRPALSPAERARMTLCGPLIENSPARCAACLRTQNPLPAPRLPRLCRNDGIEVCCVSWPICHNDKQPCRVCNLFAHARFQCAFVSTSRVVASSKGECPHPFPDHLPVSHSSQKIIRSPNPMPSSPSRFAGSGSAVPQTPPR